RFGDAARKPLAIDRERRAGRHARRVRGAQHDGTEAPHLLLQQTYRVIEFVASEGITADEFSQMIGLVHGGATDRTHLVEGDGNPSFGGLPSRFAARQAAADYV